MTNRAAAMGRRGSAVALILGLILGLGCQQPGNGPTTAEFDHEREALVARLKQKNGGSAAPSAAGPASAVGEADSTNYASTDEGFTYDRTGKRDPFRSVEWEQRDQFSEMERGPLEQYDVSQLTLSAIVWSTGRARGLVQDPSGSSYIVERGTLIGKHDGRVIDIDDNRLMVKETYVDLLGQETTKDLEMQIRTSQGG